MSERPAMLTVRNLDPVVKAKLRERAARHGRSMEAEVRDILAEAVERNPRPIFIDIVRDSVSGIDVQLDLPERSREVSEAVIL